MAGYEEYTRNAMAHERGKKRWPRFARASHIVPSLPSRWLWVPGERDPIMHAIECVYQYILTLLLWTH